MLGRNSTARHGSVAHTRMLRLEPLEERRLLALDAVLVRDINVGEIGSRPGDFTDVNGTVFFSAEDATSGHELWKSDGTEAGTVLVRDLTPGGYPGYVCDLFDNYGQCFEGHYDDYVPHHTFPSNLTSFKGALFFMVSTGASEILGLWKSDGTETGTVRVKDIGTPISTGRLTNIGDALYFAAFDGVSGIEHWKSDGTETGTVRVKDIHAGSDSSNPRNLTNVEGVLFFSADDGASGTELWKSDGTEAGTVRVKDILRETGLSSNPKNLVEVDGELFFRATDGKQGYELWKSDGTEAGTVRVKDILPGSGNSYPRDLTNVSGTLYFAATDDVSGDELWKSDGTEPGTVRVKDIHAGNESSSPRDLTNVEGELYFAASDDISGDELWKSDGTEAGTVRVKDIPAGTGHSDPRYLTNVDGTLYLSADDGASGRELWKSDGTVVGTVLVHDIWPGPRGCNFYYGSICLAPVGSSNPVSLTNANGTLFFTADDGIHGRELWKVVVEDEAMSGDTNGDGAVNIEDLNNVRNHFGETGDGVLGDTAPFDGNVDILDLNAVRNNFGTGPGSASRHDREAPGAPPSHPRAFDSSFGRSVDAESRLVRQRILSARAADVLFQSLAQEFSTSRATKRVGSYLLSR